jgi:hypothetical protein
MPNGEKAAPEKKPDSSLYLPGMSANKNGEKNRFADTKGAVVSGKETLITLLTKIMSKIRVGERGEDRSSSFCTYR